MLGTKPFDVDAKLRASLFNVRKHGRYKVM